MMFHPGQNITIEESEGFARVYNSVLPSHTCDVCGVQIKENLKTFLGVDFCVDCFYLAQKVAKIQELFRTVKPLDYALLHYED